MLFLVGIAAPAQAYRAFVAHVDSDLDRTTSVSSFSTETASLDKPDLVLKGGLRGIAIAPDGRRAYAANIYKKRIVVIDTSTNRRATPDIVVGRQPSDVAITPDGAKAYVTNRGDGDLSVIDLETNTLAGPDIPVGGSPESVAITPDGSRAYTTVNLSDVVSVIDTSTDTVVGPSIPLGTLPFDIVITPDGSRAYVADLFDGEVSVIDTATNSLVGSKIGVGSKPSALAVVPDGSKVYVANSDNNDVSVISTATDTLAGPDIPVGRFPSGIAATPDGKRVYVANQASDDVSVINTATNLRAGPNISTKGDGPYGIAIASVPPPPSPILAKKVNVEPVKGKVATRCRGEKKFTRLTEAEQIPVGCLVDTRKGTVELTSARDAAGGVQSAEFRAGLFRVTQKASRKPFTELKLAGATGCPKPKKKRSASALLSSSLFANTSRKKGKKGKKGGRRLWGKGKGRFTTKGKYGSASVRGTTWLVQDRCDRSTLFRVSEGKVKVRDFVKKKNVTLKKGGRYVARARQR